MIFRSSALKAPASAFVEGYDGVYAVEELPTPHSVEPPGKIPTHTRWWPAGTSAACYSVDFTLFWKAGDLKQPISTLRLLPTDLLCVSCCDYV